MKKDVKKALNQAIDRLPHPTFEDIADAPVKKLEAMDFITRQEPAERKRNRRAVYRLAFSVCMCLMLTVVGSQYVRRNLLVDSVIDLDVNPSFEITSNKKDHVLHVKGLNSEAEELLNGRSYRGWEVNETVEALIISLDDSQYINTERNTILLSVSSRDKNKAEQMKTELYDCINQTLSQTGTKSVVVRQNRSDDKQLAQKAGRYQISSGKMQLVEKLTRQVPELQEEDLANAPVEELYRILRQQEADIPDWLEIDDDDWYDDDDDSDDDDSNDGDSDDGDTDDDDTDDDPDESKPDIGERRESNGARSNQPDGAAQEQKNVKTPGMNRPRHDEESREPDHSERGKEDAEDDDDGDDDGGHSMSEEHGGNEDDDDDSDQEFENRDGRDDDDGDDREQEIHDNDDSDDDDSDDDDSDDD